MADSQLQPMNDDAFAEALADICDNLGCARDNEAALMAIDRLRAELASARKALEEAHGVLRLLDRLGGLGYEKHDMIRSILNPEQPK